MTAQPNYTHILAAATIIVLESWPDDELAALGNAVLLYGRVSDRNMIFKRAVETKICKADGELWNREALEIAIGTEMRRRHPELFTAEKGA